MSFSSSFLGGVSKISANVTEGRSQGAITKVLMIKKNCYCLPLSSAGISVCH